MGKETFFSKRLDSSKEMECFWSQQFPCWISHNMSSTNLNWEAEELKKAEVTTNKQQIYTRVQLVQKENTVISTYTCGCLLPSLSKHMPLTYSLKWKKKEKAQNLWPLCKNSIHCRVLTWIQELLRCKIILWIIWKLYLSFLS